VAWAEPITTVITDALPCAVKGLTTGAQSSHARLSFTFSALTCLFLELPGWISVAGLASRSCTWSRYPKSRPADDHHHEPPKGLNGRELHHAKGSDSHAVRHSPLSRLDRTLPLTRPFAVGVAGFEPTASSSRSNECATSTSAFQRY
jgi:hypothetical protein